MKRLVLISAAVLAASSCGLSETGVSRRPPGGDIWRNPSHKIDSSENIRNICYVTGLDYPDGYNWRADPENGTVKCSLVVFADGVPVMKVPVGKEYHVSPDPDMHRMIGGHLYTDFSTTDETVIKKDGQELFRYSGREMICGMAVSGPDIYTLGQSRNGNGFSYRKNGEVVLKRQVGRVFPRLQHESDSICFAFCEPVQIGNETIERYHHVMNGKIRQIAVREDLLKVWDVIWHGGEVCYLATMSGIAVPVIVCGEIMKGLELSVGNTMVTCRLISAGNNLAAEGIYSYRGMYHSSGLWKEASLLKSFPNGMTVGGICTWNDGICCVSNSGWHGGRGMIYRCGEIFNMPANYTSIGNSTLSVIDGILHVGLSPVAEGKPVIWSDGILHELDINGFICTVSPG